MVCDDCVFLLFTTTELKVKLIQFLFAVSCIIHICRPVAAQSGSLTVTALSNWCKSKGILVCAPWRVASRLNTQLTRNVTAPRSSLTKTKTWCSLACAKTVPHAQVNNLIRTHWLHILPQIRSCPPIQIKLNLIFPDACRHAVALLLWLHRRSEDPATTSDKCYWDPASLLNQEDLVPVQSLKEMFGLKEVKMETNVRDILNSHYKYRQWRHYCLYL